MNSRFATNLLLAVIAGVLLFGRDWMMISFRNGMILLAVIAVLFAIFWIIWWPIRSFIEAVREAQGGFDRTMVIIAALFMLCAVPLVGYAGLLWLGGAEEPLQAAMASSIGTVWVYVMIGGIGVVVLGVLYTLLSDGRWKMAPAVLRNAGFWYLKALIAPVWLPVEDWGIRKAQRSGIMVRVLGAIYTVLIGIVLCLLGIGAAALVFAAVRASYMGLTAGG